MNPTETVLQVIRTWLKAYGATTALTDAQVIVAEAPVRPPLPYITVKVTAPDIEQGWVEPVHAVTGAGIPTVAGRQSRSASVSIQGHGAASYAWLQRALLALAAPENVRITLEAASLPPLGIRPGGITDISEIVDTSQEARFLLEVVVYYQVTGAALSQTPLVTVRDTHTQTAPGSADLVRTINIDA